MKNRENFESEMHRAIDEAKRNLQNDDEKRRKIRLKFPELSFVNKEKFENKLYEAIEECGGEIPREWKITCENPEEDNFHSKPIFENWLVKNGYETLTKASKFHGGLAKALYNATEKRADVNVYQKLDMMVI